VPFVLEHERRPLPTQVLLEGWMCAVDSVRASYAARAARDLAPSSAGTRSIQFDPDLATLDPSYSDAK
jgi:hypothetical protein